MPKYRVNAACLNQTRGDIFESDDPFYEPFEKQGYLSIIKDDAEAPEEPSDGPDGDTGAGAPDGAPSDPDGAADDDKGGDTDGGTGRKSRRAAGGAGASNS